MIGAGAKILGNIEIGHCARVAAGSVVLKPVPHNTTVAGVPAKVVGEAGCAEPSRTMDQYFHPTTRGLHARMRTHSRTRVDVRSQARAYLEAVRQSRIRVVPKGDAKSSSARTIGELTSTTRTRRPTIRKSSAQTDLRTPELTPI